MKNLFYILKDVLRRSQHRKISIKQIACVVNRHVSMYGLIYLIIKVKTLHINTNKKDRYMGPAC